MRVPAPGPVQAGELPPMPAQGSAADGRPEVIACCSTLYGHPLAELIVGESFHPGGLTSTRKLLIASGLPPGARLLDVGCGLGASARLAAAEFGLQVDAVDASAEVIERAANRGRSARVRWQTADLVALPFETETFDGVLAECVLSTTSRAPALAELRRVLRPDGRLLISDIQAEAAAVSSLATHPILGVALCVTDAWLPDEFEMRLSNAGFILEHRRDRSSTILDLIDRAEARIALAVMATRDLGLDFAALGGPAVARSLQGLGPVDARRLAGDVRDAVGRGELGYFAAVARRSARPA